MAEPQARLVVEGASQLARALGAVGGAPLRAELGLVHKKVGMMIIREAGGRQTGVGTGAGSTLRPSAATREVTIRVGGSHRSSRAEQWGKQQTWPAPERPNIIGAAIRIQDDVIDEYIDGVEDVLERHLPRRF